LTRKLRPIVFTLAVGLTISAAAWPQSVVQIKTDYQAVSAKVEKRIVDGQWIDDDPESRRLLASQWTLAGEWIAAWLNARPSLSAEEVKAAIKELAPSSEPPDYLALNGSAFVVAGPGPIGNVFIVAKSGGQYRLAWSTAQVQQSSGKQAEVLAAWRAENARHGGRGPYWAASGRAGPVSPRLGRLPDDAAGHSRFYIDGFYAQSAGGTTGAQISLWIWDGATARPLIARDYVMMIDQKVGTRLEGDLLKVQQKKSFRTFFSCGSCEERQTDWIVRVTGESVQELGEKTVVPELDAVDEFFYRLIQGKSATALAAPRAIVAGTGLVRDARDMVPAKEWRKFPTLGMMMGWKLSQDRDDEVLCLNIDLSGSNLFRLGVAGNRFFIRDIRESKEGCEK
jgi:hypothetical protein